MLKDTKILELVERADYDMASVVKISIDITTIGGGDSKGDISKSGVTDQFVIDGSLYHKLGRVLGVHIGCMVDNLVDSLKDYAEFKDAVIEGFDDHLSSIQSDLDDFDKEST